MSSRDTRVPRGRPRAPYLAPRWPVAAVERAGGRAMAVAADVADGRATLKMFTRFLSVWNTIDLVVNNAGIAVMAPHVVANFEAVTREALAGGPPTTPVSATSPPRRCISLRQPGIG